jgi:hypothetical protein
LQRDAQWTDAGESIKTQLRELLPFVKDVGLLIEELVKDGNEAFRDLAEGIVKLILDPAAQRLSVTRARLTRTFHSRNYPDQVRVSKAAFRTQEDPRPQVNLYSSRSACGRDLFPPKEDENR